VSPSRHRRAVLLGVLLACLGAPAAASARPLATGVTDPAGPGFQEPDPDADYARIRAAGATIVRMPVAWDGLAPERPADPADPADPGYRWGELDARMARALRSGLQPLVSVSAPPGWARESGRFAPRTAEVGALGRALARRYPGVRRWQVWNEPNLDSYLEQDGGGVARYRAMVNAFAAAVKAVDRDNLVVAGGLGPFGGAGRLGSVRGSYGMRPLPFMRRLLCLPGAKARRRTCKERVRFDVWAHHPYTSGGPTHSALQPGDVSLGDLPEMKRLLDRARRLGAIRSPGPPQFWVTEFSWDTNPPDGGGVPLGLHARWVSEALYRMWRAGVSQVTWFQLRDKPLAQTPSGIWQSGLYFLDGREKPALRAFRFPFVAFRAGRSASVWGRTPGSDARRARIEQLRGTRWQTLRSVRSDRDGIFRARVARRGSGPLRARVAGDVSQPFSLVRPKDRSVNPFGTGAAPE
jgi:hypothetical protein